MTSPEIDPSPLPAPYEAPRRAEHAHAIDISPVGPTLCVDEGKLFRDPLQWRGQIRVSKGQRVPEAVVTAVE